MFILNDACYLATYIGAIYFFYNSVIISQEHLKRSICQGHCVYFTTIVATIHIITSGLWLIREKLNDMLIWGKPFSPCSFKDGYLFTELVAVIFIWKEEKLQTLAFERKTFGTTTFSNELLFQSTYSLDFLLWNCTF